jgi:hypothetical protein
LHRDTGGPQSYLFDPEEAHSACISHAADSRNKG